MLERFKNFYFCIALQILFNILIQYTELNISYNRISMNNKWCFLLIKSSNFRNHQILPVQTLRKIQIFTRVTSFPSVECKILSKIDYYCPVVRELELL